MQHLFLNIELSKLAKDKGYDEPAFARYNKGRFELNKLGTPYFHNSGEISRNYIAAPLYDQIIDWFMRKYFLEINVVSVCSVNEILGFNGKIGFMINQFLEPDIYIDGTEDKSETLSLTITEAFKLI